MAKKRTAKHMKKPGISPGSVIYTGEKTSKSLFIESFDYSKDSVNEVEHATVTDLFNYKTTDTITWININGLNHTKEIEAVGNYYNIHPLTLEDIVNVSGRPKIDEFENYLYVVIKMLYYDKDDNIKPEQVSFVLGDYYVLSFQEAEGDVFNSLRERIRFAKGRIRTMGSDYLLYALMDSVVDHYFVIIETISNKIEDLEENLFNCFSAQEISKQIQDLKREILKIRRAIYPLREIINRVEKSENKLINDNTLRYFKDVYDHVIQISENIEIYREMTFGLMDMYMTTINNKMNEVMKVLTIIATIFIPLTFIAGVYGMNFENIPELKYKYSYFILWGIMITLFISMLFYFKKKKWL
jgi:magnesium transporter